MHPLPKQTHIGEKRCFSNYYGEEGMKYTKAMSEINDATKMSKAQIGKQRMLNVNRLAF